MAGRVMFAAGAIVLMALSWWLIRRFTNRARDIRLSEFDNWESWPNEKKVECLRESRVRQTEVDAGMWRGFLLFCVVTISFGTASLVWIESIVTHVGNNGEFLCETNQSFRELLGARVTTEIRDLQRERDDTADRTGRANSLEELPGYDQLGPAIRRFLNALTEANIARAQTEVDLIDARLASLRVEADAIRAFNREVSCP